MIAAQLSNILLWIGIGLLVLIIGGFMVSDWLYRRRPQPPFSCPSCTSPSVTVVLDCHLPVSTVAEEDPPFLSVGPRRAHSAHRYGVCDSCGIRLAQFGNEEPHELSDHEWSERVAAYQD